MFWKKALSITICLVLLAGCGKGSTKKPQPQTEPETSASTTENSSEIEHLAETISTDYRIAEPCVLGEDLLTGLLDIDKKDIAEYIGYVSMTPEVPDCIIIINPQPKKASKIRKKLENRREYVLDAYKNAPEPQHLKAAAGKVFAVQDYLVLVIAGRPTKDPVQEVQDIVTLVEKTLNNTSTATK